MHIVAGTHHSRKLAPLTGQDIRPTSARTREALFNILMHRFRADGTSLLQEARLADICCGSGAIGLEAISRGVSHVTFVDKTAAALNIAKKNAVMLKETDKCIFLQTDATHLSPASAPYDIVFADPPYDTDLLPALFVQLVNRGWLHKGSIVVTEQQEKALPVTHPLLELIDTRTYGKSVLRIYEHAKQ
jgi:16S rRNA (guanine966-N2)-methyltransferase